MTNDQIPMTNKVTITNDQSGSAIGFGHWSLVIGHLLVTEIWSLVISVLLVLGGCDAKPAVSQSNAKSPRIASLVPAVTDLITGMGAGDHLVAVSNWDKRPELEVFPHVGDFESTDWEKLSQARPEIMVIFMSIDRMPAGIKQRADKLGIQVVNVKTERVADIFSTIDALGTLLNEPDKAAALSKRIYNQLDTVAQRVSGKPPVPTLVARTDEAFELIGGETFVDDILTIAGGTNVAASSMKGYPAADAERIMQLSPQAVIQLVPDASPQVAEHVHKMWEKLPDLPAMKTDRIYLLSDWYVLQPGSHIGDLAEAMAGKLHPQ